MPRPNSSDSGQEIPPTLEILFKQTLDRRRTASKLRVYTLPQPGSVDFSSNDFLSLATSSLLKSTFQKELSSFLSPPTTSPDAKLGSTGSRALDGNSEYAETLEEEISRFHGAEAGLLVNSGFDGNVAMFATLPQSGDVVVYDELVHASAHDGLRLSRARKKIGFRHNDVDDLKRVIEEAMRNDPEVTRGVRHVFVAVESVYSMDGDRAPVGEIVSLIEEVLPKGNGHVIVDEAHATGVVGPKGKGLVFELGLETKVLARLHTFGKALGCGGAIILCSSIVRSYLVNYARSTIYTTFMPSTSLVAIRAAYSLLEQGKTQQLQMDLQSLTQMLFVKLQELITKHKCRQDVGRLLSPPTTLPQSPIFSLISTKPRSLARYCQERGFLVRPIMPPTVPEGTARVRVCLHARNTGEQIRGLVTAIDEWLAGQHKIVTASPRL